MTFTLGSVSPTNDSVIHVGGANAGMTFRTNTTKKRAEMIAMSSTDTIMESEPLAPGMLGGSDLWVRLEEVMEHMQQRNGMFPISTMLSLPNIIDDHIADLVTRPLIGQETGECRRGNLR